MFHTKCLSVFDHFVELALKGLISFIVVLILWQRNYLWFFPPVLTFTIFRHMFHKPRRLSSSLCFDRQLTTLTKAKI